MDCWADKVGSVNWAAGRVSLAWEEYIGEDDGYKFVQALLKGFKIG